MFEESVRIPFIMAGPDIPQGKRIKEPISIVDVYPTLLDFYGLPETEREKNLPGISLQQVIQEKTKKERCIYSEYFSVGYEHSVFMLRMGNYKLVYFVGNSQCQLFDLEKDPKEQNDLGGQKEFAEIVERLKRKLYQIVNPEQLDELSLKAQEKMVEERGGIEAILSERKGKSVVPFTPVPEGLIDRK